MTQLTADATEERNSVAYHDLMAKNATPQDRKRSDLAALAEESRTFPERRRAAVLRAREEPGKLTWREIAALLDMTEAGLRKAMNADPSEPSNT